MTNALRLDATSDSSAKEDERSFAKGGDKGREQAAEGNFATLVERGHHDCRSASRDNPQSRSDEGWDQRGAKGPPRELCFGHKGQKCKSNDGDRDISTNDAGRLRLSMVKDQRSKSMEFQSDRSRLRTILNRPNLLQPGLLCLWVCGNGAQDCSPKESFLAGSENHLHQWMFDKHAVDRVAVLFIQNP